MPCIQPKTFTACGKLKKYLSGMATNSNTRKDILRETGQAKPVQEFWAMVRAYSKKVSSRSPALQWQQAFPSIRTAGCEAAVRTRLRGWHPVSTGW